MRLDVARWWWWWWWKLWFQRPTKSEVKKNDTKTGQVQVVDQAKENDIVVVVAALVGSVVVGSMVADDGDFVVPDAGSPAGAESPVFQKNKSEMIEER